MNNISDYKPTILYVEDDDGIRDELSRFLNRYTNKLYIAINGKEGLDIYMEHKPDIILSDIKMPIMSGFEMAKEIKKIDSKQPIIFTTAHNDNIDYMMETIELNIDAYITKPIDYSQLKDKLDSIVEKIKANLELKHYQKYLEERVNEEVAKNKEQEHILFQQSKLAQMGEMLNMIAHQWRQPLCVISVSSSDLSLKNSLGILKSSDIEKCSDIIIKTTQSMSDIINDFMNFNKSSVCEDVLLYKSADEVKKIIDAQFKSVAIELNVNIDKELKVYHNHAHIKHTILNIVLNARDAFEENKIENKIIKIYIEESLDLVTLVIEDNAGGINSQIIDRIFEPYFTTKDEGKGTGIGLYMSKKIITSVPNSYLDVETSGSNTFFKLSFKKI